jgi:hypothetical protein
MKWYLRVGARHQHIVEAYARANEIVAKKSERLAAVDDCTTKNHLMKTIGTVDSFRQEVSRTDRCHPSKVYFMDISVTGRITPKLFRLETNIYTSPHQRLLPPDASACHGNYFATKVVVSFTLSWLVGTICSGNLSIWAECEYLGNISQGSSRSCWGCRCRCVTGLLRRAFNSHCPGRILFAHVLTQIRNCCGICSEPDALVRLHTFGIQGTPVWPSLMLLIAARCAE